MNSLIIDNISTYIKNHQLAIGMGTPSTPQDVFDKTIAYIPVDIGNVTRVFKRQPWISDIVCNQIGDEPNAQYIYNNLIYVCLSNNNGAASKVAPSGTNLTNVLKSDGYVWRYVGSLLSQDMNKSNDWCGIPASPVSVTKRGVIARVANIVHNNPLFVPEAPPITRIVLSTRESDEPTPTGGNLVVGLDNDDGSIKYISCSTGSENYKSSDFVTVTDNINGSGASVDLDIVDGVISDASVLSSGVGYGNSDSNVSILVIGDGSGAELSANVAAGSLTGVTVAAGGENYTWAKAFVFSSGAAAVAQIVLEPYNGVGYRLYNDLSSNVALISKNIHVDGVIYNNMQFNFVALVSNVNNRVGNLAGKAHPTATSKESIVQDLFTVNTITTKTYSTGTSTTVQYVIQNGD